jgi:hypothetical protein
MRALRPASGPVCGTMLAAASPSRALRAAWPVGASICLHAARHRADVHAWTGAQQKAAAALWSIGVTVFPYGCT